MPRAITPVATPNPNALRFGIGEDLLGSESRTYTAAAEAADVAWAVKLFEIPGVVGLFAVKDFVTVTKDQHTAWEAIVPHVIEVLQNASF